MPGGIHLATNTWNCGFWSNIGFLFPTKLQEVKPVLPDGSLMLEVELGQLFPVMYSKNFLLPTIQALSCLCPPPNLHPRPIPLPPIPPPSPISEDCVLTTLQFVANTAPLKTFLLLLCVLKSMFYERQTPCSPQWIFS